MSRQPNASRKGRTNLSRAAAARVAHSQHGGRARQGEGTSALDKEGVDVRGPVRHLLDRSDRSSYNEDVAAREC